MAEFLIRCIAPALAWLAIAGADPAGFLVGALAVAGAAALGLRLDPGRTRAPRPGMLAALAPRFLWRSLLGGIDVAGRALSPRMPLKPGWSVLPTRLPAGAPRVALAGAFSLMPGTLVAGSRGDRLLVHCLDTDAPVAAEVRAEEVRLMAALRVAAAGPDGYRGRGDDAR